MKPKTERIEVRVESAEKHRLIHLSERLNISLAEYVRRSIRKGKG